jgi:ribosomal protein S18 acetylase RimI-like enzyme
MLTIREYSHDSDWKKICHIHDISRLVELKGSASINAFIPLKDCYQDEELFQSSIYVGEVDQKIIGFVAYNKNEITWLYIKKSQFRKGYGKQLLSFVLKKLDEPAKVTVLNNNIRAINLYQSFGFQIVEEKKGKIPNTDVEAIGYKMKQK